MDNDVVMEGVDLPSAQRPHLLNGGIEPRTFVIAIDFGTTCSSIAYAGINHNAQRARLGLEQVEYLTNFPNKPFRDFDCCDVPTEISYRTNASRQIAVPEPDWHVDDSSSEEFSDNDSVDKNASIAKSAGQHQPPKLAGAPPLLHEVEWGFGVQELFRNGDTETHACKHLRRFKLMLDDSEITRTVRDSVAADCKILKDQRLIENDLDIIADYLDQLFRWTKRQLQRTDGYKDHEPIEFVLCVPAAWKSAALWKMQLAMAKAIENSGLGKSCDGAIENLFLVSEPEAAAAAILAAGKTKFKLDETFMVLDAGGGTVDAVTYRVERTYPLRLKEVVEPKGELCGSSFINERFQELLEKRLKDETYLEANGETLAHIIDGLIVEFERQDKKRMDDNLEDDAMIFKIKIQGLRANAKLGFDPGRLKLKSKEIEKKLFRPSLDGAAKLMNEQLDAASEHNVEKVLLIGGFGQSQRLERHLRKHLDQHPGPPIELVVANLQGSSAAVARGGVLRALRKEDGPTRHLQASFGFLRTEPYGQHEEHNHQIPETDKVDGRQYIYNTIDWVLEKGEIVPAEVVINRRVENTFGINRKKLLCKEFLYVSDSRHPSHYEYKHPLNHGAEPAGMIEVDLTRLKTPEKRVPRPGGFPYWKIGFTLRIIVNGRDMRYEVFLDGQDSPARTRDVSIAAAFRPGTN